MIKSKYALASSIALATSLSLCTQGKAQSQLTENKASEIIRNIKLDPLTRASTIQLSQVTSVSELSDVQPTDWAFASLQSLVERYGCIKGYPDKIYRGQRAMTRFEFAAGLNACLDKINEVISAGLADKVSKDDLATLQRLQEEFAAELAALKGRVDALEGKAATLEKQQFSTTTKLSGSVQFVTGFATNATGGTVGTDNNSNVVFGGRVRLNFNTSFTGQDLLRTRLQFGSVPGLNATSVGSNMARLGFDENTSGTFQLDDLWYRFPIGSNITAHVGVKSTDFDEVFDNVSAVDSSDRGALSRFNRRDALVFRGPEGAGAALIFKASDQLDIGVTYLADGDTVTNPSGQGGLTNGGYSAGAQILFKPIKNLKLSAVYRRTFEPGSVVNLGGSTGSAFTSRPFGRVDTSTDRYGFQMDWKLFSKFSFGGSVSFVNARSESSPNRGATADLITWSVNLGFPDLFGDGNYGAIIFGQPPRVTSVSTGTNLDAQGTSYNLEIHYRYRISRNISIQPGVFLVFNPDHNSANDTIVVGALRTIFSF